MANLDEQLKQIQVYNENPSTKGSSQEGFRVYGFALTSQGSMPGSSHSSQSGQMTPVSLQAIVGRDPTSNNIYTADMKNLRLSSQGEIYAANVEHTPLRKDNIQGFADYNTIKQQFNLTKGSGR